MGWLSYVANVGDDQGFTFRIIQYPMKLVLELPNHDWRGQKGSFGRVVWFKLWVAA
jgi:hypothetical protein